MAKITFKIKDKEGKELELAVVSPKVQDLRQADLVAKKTWKDSVDNGLMLRVKLDEYLRRENMWDDNKENSYKKLRESLLENEKKLARGGIKKSEARNIALQMRNDRLAIQDLIADRTDMDSRTAEGTSENMRFNFLISACTVYNNDGKRYFQSLDDYLERMTEEATVEAARHLASLIYGSTQDYQANLPENRFLKQYGYVDDKLRLVNDEGHLIDNDGRLIDETGRFIDKKGNFVDINGNPVTESGEIKEEFSPFLDDNGKPIVIK